MSTILYDFSSSLYKFRWTGWGFVVSGMLLLRDYRTVPDPLLLWVLRIFIGIGLFMLLISCYFTAQYLDPIDISRQSTFHDRDGE